MQAWPPGDEIAVDPPEEPDVARVRSSVAPKAARCAPEDRVDSLGADLRPADPHPSALVRAWVRWTAADSDPAGYTVALMSDDHSVRVVHWAELIQGGCSELAPPQAGCWAAPKADDHYA